ncbi:hypothetical protein [Pseudonocardia sp. N23]|uniref:hypothetical protein n=1 Tax=Pseudonocardia sp. N23 TaxID=1987376 RepID=UPI000C023D2B|nr:hypothetical protein [Pseudonocardia sp. N23]GAY10972.1 hypothetical protein TOK_5457 [Pseudonocardia sp. N23]
MQTLQRRDWQQALLVLSLILGVVAMHSAVACGADAGHAQNAAIQGAAGPPMRMVGLDGPAAVTADANAVTATGSASASADSRGGQQAAATAVLVVPATSDMHATDLAGPAGPAGGHSVLHDLLHLCLAVLTILLALAGAVLLAVVVARATRPDTIHRGGRPAAGPRAPPPTSVRLAQLCVLRN